MSADLTALVTTLAQRARAASLQLGIASPEAKNEALAVLADLIDVSHAAILEANQRDVAAAAGLDLPASQIERLMLTPDRLTHLARSVREVMALPDPVGEILEQSERPNGLHLRKIRVPIGVIAIIYESRPNVTIDCAVLCVKSGNAAILRGGKECLETNKVLAALVSQALAQASLPGDAVQLVPTTDRAALTELLKLDSLIHCVIPRGGEGLIRFVTENSRIPVIKHFKGVCFAYVDQAADPAMAESIGVNGKTQRPSVCNALEQLLVHASVADTILPRLGAALIAAQNVELRCDERSLAILRRAVLPALPASTEDYTAEFLDYILAVRVVDSVGEAISIINRDSSAHSDVIITADPDAANRFLSAVDSAAVLWNASTRFNDGFELGLGAEIGISTDRLHARGPMGLKELCSYKWIVTGTGQVRS